MRKKILITDDESGIVLALKIRLEHEGYEVITAYNGTETLEKLRQERPDLLILDIFMPDIDGIGILNMIRESKTVPEGVSKMPVVVITAASDSKVKNLIKGKKITDYINKPIETEELLKKIRELLVNR